MSVPKLIASDWPLIIVEWPAEITTEEVGAHFAELSHLLDACAGRFGVVVDGTQAKVVHSTLRARAADGIRQVTARALTRIVGVGYVAPSVIVRGAVTAIHWVAGSPFPTCTVATRAEAVEWVRSRLRGEGLRGAGAKETSI